MDYKKLAIYAAIIGGVALIGGQLLLGELPPALFYTAFPLLVGGAMYVRFERIWKDYQNAAARGEGKQHLIITIVFVTVIAVAGYFFITS